MNFLEAFDELSKLSEASDHYRIPPHLKFSRVNGKCPGCFTEFDKQQEYEQHLMQDCNKVLTSLKMPARVKVGKKGHSYDELTNITEEEMLDYVAKHPTCEICGDNTVGVRPDHKHNKDSSHSGTFRGVLCNRCNLLLGALERKIGHSNSLPYGEYLANMKRYLDRGEKWTTNAPFTKPNLDFKFEHDISNQY